ncbi:MAG TPA: ATP-binding protein [Desulfomonilia bacterium]
MKEQGIKYFEKAIRKNAGRAISDYSMIKDGDKVMVAISGGKDSIVLLKILHLLQKAAPVDFEFWPVHVSTGYEKGFDAVSSWSESELGLKIDIINSGISAILAGSSDPEKSPCALCSRLRRGVLYTHASRTGATSIALGHHLDDIVETFLLRCFFTGQIGAMSPSRVSDDGKNRIIRPLAYCTEEMIASYFSFLDVKHVTNECIMRKDGKRRLVKDYIRKMEKDIPNLRYSIFASLSNVDMKGLCIRD